MKLQKKVKMKYEIGLMLICALILFVFGIYNVGEIYGLTIGVDDFGYINNARFFLNRPWEDLGTVISYYSFGYSFIILPLVAWIQDPTMLIQVIVGLNVVALVITYFIFCKCMLNFFSAYPVKKIIFFCFVAQMYVANYVYAKYALAECFIQLCFWIIVYLLQKIVDKRHIGKITFLGILAGYLFFIHQRMLVVVIALAITILLLFFSKNIKAKEFVFFFFGLGMVLIIGNIVKNSVLGHLYLNNVNTAHNDFSGQIGKLAYALTSEGMTDLIYGFMAKVYYFLVGTFGLGGLGIWYSVRKGILIFRKRENDKRIFIHIFMVLCFLFSITLEAFFLIVPNRYDLVIYGRYVEFIYGFFLVEGLFVLVYDDTLNRKINILYTIMILCGLAAVLLFEKYHLEYVVSYLSPATYVFFHENISLEQGIYISLLIVILIITIITFLSRKYQKWKTKLCVCFAVLWMFYACTINQKIESDHLKLQEEYTPMVNLLKTWADNIGYMKDEDLTRIIQIQYLASDKNLKGLEYEELDKLDGNWLVLVEKANVNKSDILKKGDIVCENYRYILVCPNGKEDK